ncbi:F0F1 ATP synthase subunit A [Arthrospiribacter ruber]|uniref:ATP synthase subunit a n=1 Tax=Arthrospiribacter ruber TaxID=2487934 RepID=A0A951MDH5_9BACT|nr:F0F1 ATP synthase subunit A [Arthrospiribacter ruber]MBW3467755.1 ATP synthase F0 subunit A [Arthrospiribacter ruber]
MVRKFLYLSVLLSVFWIGFSNVAVASGDEDDKTGFIMHHVKDSHEWHFATFGHTHVTLPLPVIIYSSDRGLEIYKSSQFQNPETHLFGEDYAHNGYFIDEHDHLQSVDGRSFVDLSITKNVAMLFIVLAVVLWIILSAASHYKKSPGTAPKGAASFIEPIVVFVRDEIALPNIGHHKYKNFTPYLLTIFFFIWFGNLLGLFPGAANLTGNIAVTAVLAIFTLFVTNLNGNKDYWKHIFATPGVPKALLPILVPVEILGAFITKPAALMIRLFVAITAGHIVILSFIGLIFVFESYAVGLASTIMVVFINVIELLVATIQAYVFTLFSAMYIGQAVAEHEHH